MVGVSLTAPFTLQLADQIILQIREMRLDQPVSHLSGFLGSEE